MDKGAADIRKQGGQTRAHRPREGPGKKTQSDDSESRADGADCFPGNALYQQGAASRISQITGSREHRCDSQGSAGASRENCGARIMAAKPELPSAFDELDQPRPRTDLKAKLPPRDAAPDNVV